MDKSLSARALHAELSKRFPGTYISVITGAHHLPDGTIGEDYFALIYDAPSTQGGKLLYKGLGTTVQELLNDLKPPTEGK